MSREQHSAFSQNPKLPRRDWRLEEIQDRGEPSAICECCGIKEIRYVHALRHADVDQPIYVGSECAKDLLRDPVIAQVADRRVVNFQARRANFTGLSKWTLTKDGLGERLRKDRYVFTVKEGKFGGWSGVARVADSAAPGWPYKTPFFETKDEAKLAIFDTVYLPTLKGPAIERDVARARAQEAQRLAEIEEAKRRAALREERRGFQERSVREQATAPRFKKVEGWER